MKKREAMGRSVTPGRVMRKGGFIQLICHKTFQVCIECLNPFMPRQWSPGFITLLEIT